MIKRRRGTRSPKKGDTELSGKSKGGHDSDSGEEHTSRIETNSVNSNVQLIVSSFIERADMALQRTRYLRRK